MQEKLREERQQPRITVEDNGGYKENVAYTGDMFKLEYKDISLDVKISRLGKYTHAWVGGRVNGRFMTAEGVSRRSYLDAPNDALGREICIGRALASLEKKIKRGKKKIQNILMA